MIFESFTWQGKPAYRLMSWQTMLRRFGVAFGFIVGTVETGHANDN